MLSNDEEKEKEEVVGNLKGNGMLLGRRLKAACLVQTVQIQPFGLKYGKHR